MLMFKDPMFHRPNIIAMVSMPMDAKTFCLIIGFLDGTSEKHTFDISADYNDIPTQDLHTITSLTSLAMAQGYDGVQITPSGFEFFYGPDVEDTSHEAVRRWCTINTFYEALKKDEVASDE